MPIDALKDDVEPWVTPAGIVSVADPIRSTTTEAIRLLHEDGLRIIMLTGDSRVTAEAVGRRLGLNEVIAEVLPQQKNEVVKRLQAEGIIVRPLGPWGAPTAIRITIGTPEQNDIFLKAFKKVMEKATVR